MQMQPVDEHSRNICSNLAGETHKSDGYISSFLCNISPIKVTNKPIGEREGGQVFVGTTSYHICEYIIFTWSSGRTINVSTWRTIARCNWNGCHLVDKTNIRIYGFNSNIDLNYTMVFYDLFVRVSDSI